MKNGNISMKIKELLEMLESITLIEVMDKNFKTVSKFFVSECSYNKEYSEIIEKEISLMGIYDNRLVIYI